MKFDSLINNEKFWDNIKYLLQVNEIQSFVSIQQDLSLAQWELTSYLNFLNEIGSSHQVERVDNQFYFYPASEPLKFSMEVSLLEWINFKNQKSEEVDAKDLLTHLKKLEVVLGNYKPSFANKENNKKDHLKTIEFAILREQILSIDLLDHKKNYFPFQIIESEGKLFLIAEEVTTSSLIHIDIDTIYTVSNCNEIQYKQEYSLHQVQDFIFNLKTMIGQELRLVLKVSEYGVSLIDKCNLEIKSPCLFQNSEGDFIWAATLCHSDEVHDWICSMGPDVQILNPSHFKVEFIRYCEHKLKKLA